MATKFPWDTNRLCGFRSRSGNLIHDQNSITVQRIDLAGDGWRFNILSKKIATITAPDGSRKLICYLMNCSNPNDPTTNALGFAASKSG